MSDAMEVRSSGRWYHTFGWEGLTKKERKDFDYKDTEEKQNESVFVRYKGHVYDLEDFCFINSAVAPHPQRPGWEKWDGYQGDSFFSGVLVKWESHGGYHSGRVRMATYFC